MAGLLGLMASGAGGQVLDLEFDRSLPITLDADASQFDRRNDRLSFQGLRISQGALGVRADAAQATRLDFEDSVWVFTGNVLIENATTRAWSDTAEVRFAEHQLASATLRGAPARFEQVLANQPEPTRGRAGVMEYDLRTGMIRMSEEAWVSDGTNEVTGARIAYDLGRQYIVATGDDGGPVRMKINPPPPEESDDAGETEPGPEPEAP